jgi:hypothetical protein
LLVPISAAGKTAQLVAPFALCNVQMLVSPLGGGKQVPYFVFASLQPIAAQRRLDSRFLDFCDVSAEFHLQRGRRGRKVELL